MFKPQKTAKLPLILKLIMSVVVIITSGYSFILLLCILDYKVEVGYTKIINFYFFFETKRLLSYHFNFSFLNYIVAGEIKEFITSFINYLRTKFLFVLNNYLSDDIFMEKCMFFFIYFFIFYVFYWNLSFYYSHILLFFFIIILIIMSGSFYFYYFYLKDLIKTSLLEFFFINKNIWVKVFGLVQLLIFFIFFLLIFPIDIVLMLFYLNFFIWFFYFDYIEKFSFVGTYIFGFDEIYANWSEDECCLFIYWFYLLNILVIIFVYYRIIENHRLETKTLWNFSSKSLIYIYFHGIWKIFFHFYYIFAFVYFYYIHIFLYFFVMNSKPFSTYIFLLTFLFLFLFFFLFSWLFFIFILNKPYMYEKFENKKFSNFSLFLFFVFYFFVFVFVCFLFFIFISGNLF